jgi:hypothetical protein
VALVDGRYDILRMKHDAPLLMKAPHELTDLRTEDSFHRPLLRCDDMNVDAARPKGRRDFEADEARAEHHGPL